LKLTLLIFFGLLILFVIAIKRTGRISSPDYKVIKKERNIQVREYAPMILAEVQVLGDRKQAINQGFRALAGYIFGGNTLNKKMAMTAPVTQQKCGGSWRIGFVMEKQYSLETLAQPLSKQVNIHTLSAKSFVVIRFNGLATDKNILKHTKKLQAYISANHLKAIDDPILAFYNPPWTLPFFRRNEVLIEIKTNQGSK
jgi:hypothetical protein